MLGNESASTRMAISRSRCCTSHGLIYVNPEGRNGNLDPVAAAADIRESFYRMAMNDEEIVALIAGGHTLGKVHGAVKRLRRAEPAAAPIEEQGLGWKNKCGKGNARHHDSGLEGAWTQTRRMVHLYLDNLLRFDWKNRSRRWWNSVGAYRQIDACSGAGCQ